jgi:hypothetical protein
MRCGMDELGDGVGEPGQPAATISTGGAGTQRGGERASTTVVIVSVARLAPAALGLLSGLGPLGCLGLGLGIEIDQPLLDGGGQPLQLLAGAAKKLVRTV